MALFQRLNLFYILQKEIRQIRNVIEKETSKNIPATISIGLYQKDITGNPEEELDFMIEKADQAMYKAKTEGKNKVRLFQLN